MIFRIVYELRLHSDTVPRYFYVANVEYPQSEISEQIVAKAWTACSHMKTIGTYQLHSEQQFCFEIYNPFDIRHF